MKKEVCETITAKGLAEEVAFGIDELFNGKVWAEEDKVFMHFDNGQKFFIAVQEEREKQ